MQALLDRIGTLIATHGDHRMYLVEWTVVKPLIHKWSCNRNNIEWHKACMKLLLDQYVNIRQLSTLPLPKEVIEASKTYMEENNPVGIWLRENFEITNDENDRILADEIWNLYKSMVDRNISKVAFGKAMCELNNMSKKMIKHGRTTRIFYICVKRLTIEDDVV